MENPLASTADAHTFRFSVRFSDVHQAAQDVTRLLTRLATFLDARDMTTDERYALSLAVEELAYNTAKYGGAADGSNLPLCCDGVIDVLPDVLRVTVTDNGVPFDPRTAPQPLLDAEPSERQVGGLGLYMLKKRFPDIRYVRENGSNRSVWQMPR